MSLSDESTENIIKIITKEELQQTVNKLRKLSYNNRGNESILVLILLAIEKGNELGDLISLVNLYSLKITHLQHQKHNLQEIIKISEYIRNLSEKMNYSEGLALYYAHRCYIEKLNGNKTQALADIKQSVNLLKKPSSNDGFIYNVCSYLFAVEHWLQKRDYTSAEILEKNIDYFHTEGMYHGFAMSLGILTIIYQQTQNRKKSIELIKRILANSTLISKIPEEIKSIIYYFIGVSHKLSFNLGETEKHLLEAERILKPIYKDSIYSGYYLTALSHLTTTYALQGKLELALDQLKRVEELLDEEIATKNLDSFNKNQIVHDFNLTKFYIQSRLYDFNLGKSQDLIQTIVSNVGTYHSNAIMLSEFLLNANFTITDLQDIKKLNNPSTKRVEHILDLLMCRGSNDDTQALQRINALKRRPVEERMTYVERAFADLLAAQEYYKINRFAEIYPLLKKYENQTHKIEVLEMRVFMEAFIQVGAYKNGDPLGPALQYMAIKKCRNYGFSRLENRLLDYLDMQRRDIQSPIL